MEMHDAWFFIGVFVFIFLIWIATGGPLHPISFAGPKLSLPGALGGGTYLSLPRAPYGVDGNNISLPGSSSGESSQNNSDIPQPSSLGGSTFGQLSPYRNIVRMNHYVSGAGSLDPANEYIEISVAQNAGIPVDISGWRIVSDAGGNVSTIPKGTEVPTSGIVNASDNIVLTPGVRATITSGRSPIGASFRENKCIGYFSSFQRFYPQLPQNCPTPSNELASRYGPGYIRDTACIDYMDKISRCQVMLSPPVYVSNACQSFMVQYLNYNGCVSAHKNDADFLGDMWRVYLGRTTSMWRTRHEVVKLLDINGKTVDAFSY
ncbi:hypothetical protein HY412_01980 [Candidatus Kaiserbacteria bacterium]|nr:hypothetical protein [Candidatus Kaiserbacteria bacterium]